MQKTVRLLGAIALGAALAAFAAPPAARADDGPGCNRVCNLYRGGCVKDGATADWSCEYSPGNFCNTLRCDGNGAPQT
jgi:hypothetical protein